MAAPTFHGVSSVPVDGPTSSLTEPQTDLAITPPSSMLAGDLVVVCLYNENGSAGDGLQINGTGGQTWTSDTTSGSYSYSGTAAGHRLYWCTFNGTWSADPTFDFPAKSGTRGCGMQMLVFRPDSTSKVWAIDTAPSWAGFSAPSTPFTVTITGLTPTNSDTVTLARWCSDDDNTWASLQGTGWSNPGLTFQYRNIGGSDLSTSYAYNLQGSPSATTDVSKNQNTLGGDAGSTVIVSFYAATPGSTITPSKGSATLTGLVPALAIATTLTAGALSLTGYAPSVFVGSDRTPTAATLTLSGTTPTVQEAWTVMPSSGTGTLTGTTPTVQEAWTVTTESGNPVTLDGYAPTVSEGDVRTPSLGTATLTGSAPTVQETGGTVTIPIPVMAPYAPAGWGPL